MLVKTSELIGPALDWAVAKCLEPVDGRLTVIRREDYIGRPIEREVEKDSAPNFEWWSPSRIWAQGGPIIEREGIGINKTVLNGWIAEYDCALTPETEHTQLGQTPLIAAMRCFVRSKLGDTVEIPAELE